MKKIRTFAITTGLIIISCFISSCDKGFTDMNINKVDPTSLNPYLIINKSIIGAWPDTQMWAVYPYAIVQQIVTPFGSSVQGANYNQISYDFNYFVIWNSYYSDVAKQAVDVIAKTRGDDTRTNIYNCARIWKAYVFMVITDTYGGVPYFEAGKGYLEKIAFPKYDSQKDIYTDILKELDEASAGLNRSLFTSPEDIMYGGDIAKWKRLGYSLMLRAAMRLTKVDPVLAKTYVTKAVAGGLMQSNGDNAVVRHSSLYINFNGYMFSGREYATFYLTKPFVDTLKRNNDPRLPVYAMRYVGALNGAQFTANRLTSDADKQIGMPLGYNNVTIATQFANNGVVSLNDYSLANINTVVSASSPEYFITYGQTQLLLAEAIIRGWTAGNASTIFANAVKANLEQMAEYGSSAAINTNAINTFVTANPLKLESALNQINTEYWIASFLNGPEVWANFRRSGFPALTPNPYPSSEIPGDFIHRMPYLISEYVVNKANLEEANARQGPDKINTRVWWDKK